MTLPEARRWLRRLRTGELLLPEARRAELVPWLEGEIRRMEEERRVPPRT